MTAKRAERGTQPALQKRSAKHTTTVSIIGAGRLGTALARALASCGYRVQAVVARRSNHARRAAVLVGDAQPPLSLNAKQLGQLPPSDLLFITTPDDAITTIAAQLSTTLRERRHEQSPGRVALHASGALSSAALKDLKNAGFATGSLHPLISVSDPVQGALSLREAFYCIEGDAAARNVARRIVRDFGAQSFSVKTRDKALYHAAAVMASGHAVALFDIAAKMLARCGLTDKRARAVLLPLVRSTIENLSHRPPARALTGTFARADLATMRRHLEAIGAQPDDAALAAYVLLGQRSLQLALNNGANQRALDEMARVLKGELGE